MTTTLQAGAGACTARRRHAWRARDATQGGAAAGHRGTLPGAGARHARGGKQRARARVCLRQHPPLGTHAYGPCRALPPPSRGPPALPVQILLLSPGPQAVSLVAERGKGLGAISGDPRVALLLPAARPVQREQRPWPRCNIQVRQQAPPAESWEQRRPALPHDPQAAQAAAGDGRACCTRAGCLAFPNKLCRPDAARCGQQMRAPTDV